MMRTDLAQMVDQKADFRELHRWTDRTPLTEGGYLLQGIATREAFFGAEFGREYRAAGECDDLIVANNVLARVPDLHDIVGCVAAPAANGWATFRASARARTHPTHRIR